MPAAFEPPLAEAEASAGETDAGLGRLDDALAELERTEQRLYEAEMHRIRGEMLLKRDRPTPLGRSSHCGPRWRSGSCTKRAASNCAALSLAKLYCAAHRDADAHAVLAPAVEGFPPTEHLPELNEAEALLATLSR